MTYVPVPVVVPFAGLDAAGERGAALVAAAAGDADGSGGRGASGDADVAPEVSGAVCAAGEVDGAAPHAPRVSATARVAARRVRGFQGRTTAPNLPVPFPASSRPVRQR